MNFPMEKVAAILGRNEMRLLFSPPVKRLLFPINQNSERGGKNIAKGKWFSTSGASSKQNNSTGNGQRERNYQRLGAGLLSGGALVSLGAISISFWNSSTKSDEKTKSSTKGEVKEEEEFDVIANIQNTKNTVDRLPVVEAKLVPPPRVPPPIQRDHPVLLRVKLDSTTMLVPLTRSQKYRAWVFNRSIPGPLIRAREGDVLEVQFTNRDEDGVAHNIDFHAVMGPGGGSPLLQTEKDQTRVARFRLLYPGLFVYHCGAGPIPMHIAQGMYGLILVEPALGRGLPPVDREFYVMQSEFYTEESQDDERLLEYSYSEGLKENAQQIVFNGREGALTDAPLMANTGERVRIFFGNAGPNLTSSFHVIGSIFDRLYRDGGLIDPPARGIQTTLVPPGGAAIVELPAIVPGTFTLLDHAIHRIDKGAVGYLKVAGRPLREDITTGDGPATPCPDCKLHE